MVFEKFSEQINSELISELNRIKESVNPNIDTGEILNFLTSILITDNISLFFIPSQLNRLTEKVLETNGLLIFLLNILDKSAVKTFNNTAKDLVDIISRIAKNTSVSRTVPKEHELSLFPKSVLETYYVDLQDLSFEEYIISLLANNVWLIPIYLIMLNADLSNLIED